MDNKPSKEVKYYQFGKGGSWIQETRDGAEIIKRTFTSDPRVDRSARVDSLVRIFPDGSWQTTWYDADGVPTIDSRES